MRLMILLFAMIVSPFYVIVLILSQNNTIDDLQTYCPLPVMFLMEIPADSSFKRSVIFLHFSGYSRGGMHILLIFLL